MTFLPPLVVWGVQAARFIGNWRSLCLNDMFNAMREATPDVTNLCYSGILVQQGRTYGVTEDTAATEGAEILSDCSRRGGGVAIHPFA